MKNANFFFWCNWIAYNYNFIPWQKILRKNYIYDLTELYASDYLKLSYQIDDKCHFTYSLFKFTLHLIHLIVCFSNRMRCLCIKIQLTINLNKSFCPIAWSLAIKKKFKWNINILQNILPPSQCNLSLIYFIFTNW